MKSPRKPVIRSGRTRDFAEVEASVVEAAMINPFTLHPRAFQVSFPSPAGLLARGSRPRPPARSFTSSSGARAELAAHSCGGSRGSGPLAPTAFPLSSPRGTDDAQTLAEMRARARMNFSPSSITATPEVDNRQHIRSRVDSAVAPALNGADGSFVPSRTGAKRECGAPSGYSAAVPATVIGEPPPRGH